MAGRPKTDGRHLRLIAPAPIDPAIELGLGDGDFDVDAPDLVERYGIGGELA